MTLPVSSTFTGADGQTLQANSASWVKVTGWTDDADILSNRLSSISSATQPSVYRYNSAPGTADYEVSSEFYVHGTTGTSESAGVIARASSSQSTHYMARWRNGTGFQLFKFVNSTSATQLGSTVAHSYSAGNTGKIRLQVLGTTIKVFRGDETSAIISVTDSSITAEGYPGIWIFNPVAADGPYLDNWQAFTTTGSADGGTGTSTGTGTGGTAAGDASAEGGTGTSTGSGTGGAAGGGTFTSDAMENNSGSGLLASIAVSWTWYEGAIGADPTSLTHGTGTTSSGGVLSVTDLPSGAGFLLVRTADSSGVYYHPGTIT